MWQFCDVIRYCGDCIHGEGIARWDEFVPARDTIWFPQAQLNYAENLLSYAYQQPDGVAIWFKNENGQSRKLTWQKLCDQVSVVQQWLTQNGVGRGDVVAGYLLLARNHRCHAGNHQSRCGLDIHLTGLWCRQRGGALWPSAA